MKKQTKSCWPKQMIFAAVATLVCMFATNSLAVAQDPNFKAGDRVEANMSNYSTSTDWRKATIVEVMMWQGNISGIYVKTDDGRQITLRKQDVRQLKEAGKNQTKPANNNNVISQPSGNTAGQTPEPGGCPMNQPPGKVTNTAKASAQLFKRVIYEWHAAKINPASISAPQQVGLTFLKFEMGAPYKNTLTSSRFGDKRLHDGAPVGAMIYPIKTRELQCDLHGTSVTRSVSERAGDCFKSRSGEWVCPLRTTKFVSRD
ncbi:MAG: hypothetical protein ACR2HX_01335 [Pyrinomonadaceae bacterium]